MAELPLDGIRIIELTQIAAGPYSTQFLGDWGAEVIRLENLQTLRPGHGASTRRSRRSWWTRPGLPTRLGWSFPTGNPALGLGTGTPSSPPLSGAGRA